jgi:hypothetical protein
MYIKESITTRKVMTTLVNNIEYILQREVFKKKPNDREELRAKKRADAEEVEDVL